MDAKLLFDVLLGASGMLLGIAGTIQSDRDRAKKNPAAVPSPSWGPVLVGIILGVCAFALAHVGATAAQIASIPVVVLGCAAVIVVPAAAAGLFVTVFWSRGR